MDAPTELATKAAAGILDANPVLGGVCVLLGLSFAAFIWVSRKDHQEERKEWQKEIEKLDATIERLHTEALASERGFRADFTASMGTLTEALATVQHTISLLTNMAHKGP